MGTKERLILVIDKYRKIELWDASIKLATSLFLLVSAPFIIYLKVIHKELFIPLILLIMMLYVVFFLKELILKVNKLCKKEKMEIFKCIESPELVTEIFVFSTKISIDIKGSENFEIKIRNGEMKSEMINLFKEYFVESKWFNKC